MLLAKKYHKNVEGRKPMGTPLTGQYYVQKNAQFQVNFVANNVIGRSEKMIEN